MNYKAKLMEELDNLVHELIYFSQKLSKQQKYTFTKLCTQDIGVIAYISNKQNKYPTATDISKKLFIPKTTIVSSITRLTQKGYLLQIQNQNDKREKYLELTEKGKEIHREHLHYEETLLNYLVSGWEKQEQIILLDLLKIRRKNV